MLLSKAIEGFLLHKQVEGLSGRTLEGYKRQLDHLAEHLGNPDLEAIEANDILQFFDYLSNEYVPKRWSGEKHPLSARSKRNYWIALKSFWTWAKIDLGGADVMDRVPAPQAPTHEPNPFTEAEIQQIIKACGETADGRPHPFEHRNRAIVLALLDSGIRATELCKLKMQDYNQRRGRIFVEGKGAKKRNVYLGSTARKAIWRYLADRDNTDDPDAPLFANQYGKPLHRHWLRRMIAEIGERANVANVHPHRFRYTFAIQYLRNQGDIFTLQRLLGHSSLKMVRYYLSLAEVDAETAHRRASPVDNWDL